MEKEKKLAKMRNNKLLCYCSKVTYQKFTLEIKGASVTKLDSICNKLKLAKYCSACLPNIEDEFFRLTGKKDSIKNFTFISQTSSIRKKILKFFDLLFGNMLIPQYGHLPMLSSKNIKTWLVISNEQPSILDKKVVPYRIKIEVFNKL